MMTFLDMYDLQWLHMQYWDRFYIYVHNNKIIVIEDLLWNSLIVWLQ